MFTLFKGINLRMVFLVTYILYIIKRKTHIWNTNMNQYHQYVRLMTQKASSLKVFWGFCESFFCHHSLGLRNLLQKSLHVQKRVF